MSVGAIRKPNFEEYLKKIGKADELKQNVGVMQPKNNFTAAVLFAKQNDVFSAAQKYQNTQNPVKEQSGANASTVMGGNMLSRFTNLLTPNTEVNNPDAVSNVGNIDAAASGHTPQGTNPVTPTALRATTGNEASDPHQNTLQKETKEKVDKYYQEFLDATRKTEIDAEQGVGESTGKATLSSGSGEGSKPGEVSGDASVRSADGGANPKPATKPEPAEKPERSEISNANPSSKKDPANANSTATINKQEETQNEQNLQKQEKLKKVEEAQKRED